MVSLVFLFVSEENATQHPPHIFTSVDTDKVHFRPIVFFCVFFSKWNVLITLMPLLLTLSSWLWEVFFFPRQEFVLNTAQHPRHTQMTRASSQGWGWGGGGVFLLLCQRSGDGGLSKWPHLPPFSRVLHTSPDPSRLFHGFRKCWANGGTSLKMNKRKWPAEKGVSTILEQRKTRAFTVEWWKILEVCCIQDCQFSHGASLKRNPFQV